MEEAIKLAIEKGGYKLFGYVNLPLFKYETDMQRFDHNSVGKTYCRQITTCTFVWGDYKKTTAEIYGTEITQDPLFWQALGRALGWDIGGVQYNEPKKMSGQTRIYLKSGWLYQWHCFIDHLAEGKDADSFFKDLIN
jgi:hypothetical protein